MSLIALYVLATMDGAFCGYRAAAGRTGLIDKRLYYRRAMLRGAWLVQGAVAGAGLILVCFLALAPERASLVRDLMGATGRMLLVYVPYAAVALVAFLVRLFPSVDFRSATSVFIFGPMTALRPIVALAGVIYGVLPATRMQTRVMGVLVLALMFGVQFSLDRRAALESDASLPAGPAV